MRRILMLSYEYPPLGGGIGIACQSLLQEFSADPSIAVDLITSGAGARSETTQIGNRVRILKLPVGKKNLHFWTASEISRWTWAALGLGKSLAKQQQYDLCHCWGGWPSGLIGYRLRHTCPYIVGLRGSDVPGYNVRLRVLDRLVFTKLSRRIWSEASAVVALSENLKSLARKTAPNLSMEVVRNGIDVELFRPGQASEPTNLLYVGRLIERKGLFYLLEAFEKLTQTFPKLHLTLVGDGPDRKQLEAYCRDHGLTGKVDLTGRLRREELLPIYQRASIFVMPSLEEALSNAVLEAMASGLPIVTTSTGARELLDENGLVVDSAEPEALRQAIEQYLSEPQLATTHGRRSRELAETMSWVAMARAYRRIYEQVVESGSAR